MKSGGSGGVVVVAIAGRKTVMGKADGKGKFGYRHKFTASERVAGPRMVGRKFSQSPICAAW